MKKRVFIDGQAGTTGLQIYDRLRARGDIEVVTIDPEKRKDSREKENILAGVDMTILCLPDNAARETVSLARKYTTGIIDASTAHRTHPEWAYGFPELGSDFRGKIARSRYITNPGCHATGFIALVYPLVAQGILPKDYPLCLTSITGYSGGGRSMIEYFKKYNKKDRSDVTARPYGLNLNHKHLPEMRYIPGLDHYPVFYPVLGDFEKGMIVSVPIHLSYLSKTYSGSDIADMYRHYYDGEPFLNVAEYNSSDMLHEEKFLSPVARNKTNELDIAVFGSTDHIMLVARFDNLGKGASGAAVQNMNIALGCRETEGL
jgi:N-acetyl-gamma-glutamyl-phosphate reductase